MAQVLENERPPLLAEAEAGDELPVTIHITVVEVAKLAPSLADKHQQAPPCVIVVLVRLEVRGEVLDPLCQHRDLDLRGTGITGVDSVLPDQFFFALFRQQPSSCSFLCLSCQQENRNTGSGERQFS